ncbi:hypothetical protein D3C87_1521860 [compost metagenome]
MCVITTVPTVSNMTRNSPFGVTRHRLSEAQSKVLNETMNITATREAMGMRATQSPSNKMNTSNSTPAERVDRRPRPPDFTLMTDWPIMAHPAIPPKKPVTTLATPWAFDSRCLSLGVSVKSSTMVAVSKDSMSPTKAKAEA